MSDGQQQLVLVTLKDIEELKDKLGFIKSQSTKKSERKTASETIIKLDKLGTDWDKSVQYKQVAFKPVQLRMVADLRDLYHMDLSPQIKNWKVPGGGNQLLPK